jgi:hypothetical protein
MIPFLDRYKASVLSITRLVALLTCKDFQGRGPCSHLEKVPSAVLLLGGYFLLQALPVNTGVDGDRVKAAIR